VGNIGWVGQQWKSDGSTMNLSSFVSRLYDLLPTVSLSTLLSERLSLEEKSSLKLVVRVVDAVIFTTPTPPSATSILTIYKRLLTCTLHMEEKEAATILKISQRMGGRYDKRLEELWDRDCARLGSGKRISGWELALSKRYYGMNICDSSITLRKRGKGSEDE
jgi:hypothetical protein